MDNITGNRLYAENITKDKERNIYCYSLANKNGKYIASIEYNYKEDKLIIIDVFDSSILNNLCTIFKFDFEVITSLLIIPLLEHLREDNYFTFDNFMQDSDLLCCSIYISDIAVCFVEYNDTRINLTGREQIVQFYRDSHDDNTHKILHYIINQLT